MGRNIEALIRAYCDLLAKMIGLFMALMVVLVFGNVVMRYGFNSGITLSEELSRWLFVWMTFLGGLIILNEFARLFPTRLREGELVTIQDTEDHPHGPTPGGNLSLVHRRWVS